MADDPNPTKSNRHGFTDSASSDAAEVGKTLITGMAPAEKGWILGFICVVAIIVLSDMWVNLKTLEASKVTAEQNRIYFGEVEANRTQAIDRQQEMFSDQLRRSQEVIKELVQAVSRDSERSGIAAMAAIDSKAEALEKNLTPAPADGPMSRIPEE